MAEIIDKTSVAEYCVSRLVVFQHANKRRGLSMRMGKGAWTWSDVVSGMVSFVAAPSLESFDSLRLDRAYVHGILSEFLRALDGYGSLVEGVLDGDPVAKERLRSMHVAVGRKKGGLLQAASEVTRLEREASRLRNRVLQVFSDHVNRMARYDAAGHSLRVSASDTRQNYWLAAMKAVNHFNQDRGAFKPYLDIWLKKARNASSHVTGSAYTPPSGVRANHLAVGDGDEDIEIGAADPIPRLGAAELAWLVDPDGYLAEALDLRTSA